MATDIEELRSLVPANQLQQQQVVTVGTAAVTEQAVAMIRGQMQLAKMFKRDQGEALTNLLEYAKLGPLAADAFYSFRRGRTLVEGLTIDVLKLCAQEWGNILFNVEEIERRDGESTAVAYAIDLQKNTMSQRRFIVKHIRDKNDDEGNNAGVALKSERDIYELIANQGSRRLRSCLEDLIPPHILGAVDKQLRATKADEAAKIPLVDRIRDMIPAFEQVGVSKAMLTKWLGGRPLGEMLEKEYLQLQTIFRSIKTGGQRVEEFFDKPTAADGMGPGKKTTPPKDAPAGEGANANGGQTTGKLDARESAVVGEITLAQEDTFDLLLKLTKEAATPEVLAELGERRKKVMSKLTVKQKTDLKNAAGARAQEIAAAGEKKDTTAAAATEKPAAAEPTTDQAARNREDFGDGEETSIPE